jgi:hypothetical protein
MAEGSRFDLSLHQVGRIHVLTLTEEGENILPPW